jgi:protein O-GlcNAc transferase
MRKTNTKSKESGAEQIFAAARSALQRGAIGDAIGLLQEATRRSPKSEAAWSLFGEALSLGGNLNGAFVAFRKAAALESTPGPSLERLAEIALRIDQWGEAIRALRELSQARPSPVVFGRLGIASQGGGDIASAIESYQQALALMQPGHGAHWRYTMLLNLGSCFHQLNRYAEAAQQAQLAASAATTTEQFEVATRNRVSALLAAGEIEQAAAESGSGEAISSSYLYALNLLMPYDPERVREAHRAWGAAAERHAAGRALQVRPAVSDRAGRRLRVGFVSADLHEHPARYFFAGLLREIDPSRFVRIVFSDVRTPDAVTAAFERDAETWIDSSGMDDNAFAAAVNNQNVDVLVDLGGHTSERIGFFAARHAPVQVTFLGYPATSGLNTIDAYLTDTLLDPPEAGDAHFHEPLVRLGPVSMTYTPPDAAPQVSELPSAAGHGFTFASFSRAQKINDHTLELWAAAMNAVPGSRLLLVGAGSSESAEAARLTAGLQARGVSSERLGWTGTLGFSEYLATHGQVDLILDCFPWSGHTVTLHAAWMGVPTLTISGRHHAGRLSESVMLLSGCSGFVASSPEGFAELAGYWANHTEELAAIRRGLREAVRQSPLMDHRSLARRFESALVALYDRAAVR